MKRKWIRSIRSEVNETLIEAFNILNALKDALYVKGRIVAPSLPLIVRVLSSRIDAVKYCLP